MYVYILYIYIYICVCVYVTGTCIAPKHHLQSGVLGWATLSNRQTLHGQHQLNIKRSHLSGFRACLPSSGWHTDKYLTNDDHISRLNIRRTSKLKVSITAGYVSHSQIILLCLMKPPAKPMERCLRPGLFSLFCSN